MSFAVSRSVPWGSMREIHILSGRNSPSKPRMRIEERKRDSQRRERRDNGGKKRKVCAEGRR